MHCLKVRLINYPFLSTASVAFYTFMGGKQIQEGTREFVEKSLSSFLFLGWENSRKTFPISHSVIYYGADVLSLLLCNSLMFHNQNSSRSSVK